MLWEIITQFDSLSLYLIVFNENSWLEPKNHVFSEEIGQSLTLNWQNYQNLLCVTKMLITSLIFVRFSISNLESVQKRYMIHISMCTNTYRLSFVSICIDTRVYRFSPTKHKTKGHNAQLLLIKRNSYFCFTLATYSTNFSTFWVTVKKG